MSLTSIDDDKVKKYMVIESLPEEVTMLGTPQFLCTRGSFTVEAAVLLPVMACFFSFILFFFQIMQAQLSVQTALEKTGRSLAVFAMEELEEGEEGNENNMANAGYLALAKASVYMELQRDENIQKYVNGGALGVSLLLSELQGDYIVLNANYVVRFPLNILGRQNFNITQRACFRKWTGWHAVDIEKQREMLVYLTTYGEVYHMRKSCPFLTLSIQKVEMKNVSVLRNQDGSKYKECVKCKPNNSNCAFAYITKYGEKYHYSIECSGLKRTIYQKRLYEVEGRNPCMKCWK